MEMEAKVVATSPLLYIINKFCFVVVGGRKRKVCNVISGGC